MTSVAFPQLVTNVIAALSASSDLAGVRIFDGPEIDGSFPTDWIAIGHDGSEEGDLIAGIARNEYAPLGAKKMFEDGAINCTLVSQTGDTTVAGARTAAYALLSKVDTVIRTDPSFSGAALYAGLDTHQARYVQTTSGFGVQIDFTIMYRARS
jgi:hypothetical protein